MATLFFDGAMEKISRGKIVIDVGGGNSFQKELASKKHLFNQSLFVSLDVSSNSKPTVCGDAQSLPFKNGIADSVICKAVLQHVPDPKKVVDEIFRILKKDGMIYSWVPFLFPYHPGKEYNDYYRFTSQGVRLLFKSFSHVEISPSSGYFTMLIKLLPGFVFFILKSPMKLLDQLINVKSQTTGWEILAQK